MCPAHAELVLSLRTGDQYAAHDQETRHLYTSGTVDDGGRRGWGNGRPGVRGRRGLLPVEKQLVLRSRAGYTTGPRMGQSRARGQSMLRARSAQFRRTPHCRKDPPPP